MTPTPPDKDELDEILLGLDLGDASEGLRTLLEKESMNSKNFQRAKQAINRLIARERLNEASLWLSKIEYHNDVDLLNWCDERKTKLEQSLKEESKQ